MARKLSIMLSLLALALVLTGASFANIVPTDVVFGTSTQGWITVTPTSTTFGGNVQGNGLQGATLVTYSIGNTATTSPTITVHNGTDTLVGTFAISTISIFTSKFSVLVGTFTVTSATQGFLDTGFPLNAAVDANLDIYNSKVSSGEIVADPVPEPGTIAMAGSGLLMAAGFLRRKLL